MSAPCIVRPLSWLGAVLAAGRGGWTVWTMHTAGWARLRGRPTSGPPLLLSGPYRFVRYPACSGLLAFLLGMLLWNPGWVTASAFIASMVGARIWIAVEEPKYLARFGEAYRRYRIAVPALWPVRWERPQAPCVTE